MLCFQVGTGVTAFLIAHYTYVSIGAVVKVGRGEKGLMWLGVCNQTGAFLGSTISFLIVNVFNLFEDQLPCE